MCTGIIRKSRMVQNVVKGVARPGVRKPELERRPSGQ